MMRIKWAVTVSLLGLCAASTSLAGGGVPDTYVSGLLQTPIGNAQLGPVDGRRLPVHNLGSSGEDGVEVRLSSAFGGGAEIDLQPLMSTPGASFRTRHKGWDGLIYGNHRLLSNGDGTGIFTFDYSEMGATGVAIVEHDASGAVVFSGTYSGPIVDLPLDNQVFYCPPGTTPTVGIWCGQLCNTCPWITVYVFYCNGTMYTNNVVVTPILPIGIPDSPGIESMSITGSGIPELIVSNANIRTYGVQCWGLDPAQISETCDNPAGCTPAERKLRVDNLGSSGQDGIGIDLPPHNGGVSVARGTKGCCRGHVIIMKLYDDAGQEQRISMTQTLDPSGTEELDADFSTLGAGGYVLTAHDAGGGVIGPREGTAIYNGGPRPVIGNLCPPGSREWWIYVAGPNPTWVFQGCLGFPMELVIPGVNTLTGVASFQLRPLNPTVNLGPLARCDMLSDDTEGLVIEDIVVAPALCPGDMNCDGAITFADIDSFVESLAGESSWTHLPCPWLNGDTNGDGGVTFADIDGFVALIGTTCP
jgi:hypothetical protein